MNPPSRDRLSEELELEREPSGFLELLFRLSLYFFLTVAVVGGICEALGVADDIASALGLDGMAFANVYFFAFLYTLTYGLLRFGKSRILKIIWVPLAILIAALLFKANQ